MKAVTAGKTLYGLPTSNYTQGLIYNRKLFSEAGLNPDQPPTTWAQVETGRHRHRQARQRHRGLGRLQRGQQRRLALLLLHGRARRHHGQQQRRRTDGELRQRRRHGDPAALHTLRFTDNAMSPTQGLAWGTLQQQFAAGKLGMYIAAPDDIYNVIVPTDKGNLSDIGMGALPSLTGTPAGSLSGGNTSCSPRRTPRRRSRPASSGINFEDLTPGVGQFNFPAAEGRRLHGRLPRARNCSTARRGTKVNQLRTQYATITTLALHVVRQRAGEGRRRADRCPGRLQDA